jgi:hypothetical protein
MFRAGIGWLVSVAGKRYPTPPGHVMSSGSNWRGYEPHTESILSQPWRIRRSGGHGDPKRSVPALSAARVAFELTKTVRLASFLFGIPGQEDKDLITLLAQVISRLEEKLDGDINRKQSNTEEKSIKERVAWKK